MTLYEKLFGRIYLEASDGAGSDLGGGGGGDVGDDSGGEGDTGDGEGAGDGGVQAAWPTDWREKISTDEKHSKTLTRFASPKALFDSYTALRQKLDSGELKAKVAFPDKGSDEDKAAWRKANGLPESADDYAKTFKSYKLDESNEAVAKHFMATAHQMNMDPSQVEGVLGWYESVQQGMNQAREEADAELLQSSEDQLRSEWGGEYRRNINLIKGLLDGIPAEVQPLFVGARLSDGRALINTPEIAQWLLQTALTVNPVGTVVPGAGANVMSAIEDEIGEIENLMRTDRKAYNSDEKKQARLRELYAAKERAKK